jgi:hypothetical protein
MTITIVLLGTIVTYYFVSKTNDIVKDKGIKVSFPTECADCTFVEDVKRSRKFKNFILNSDTVNNEKTIIAIRETLNQIKSNGDSVNGIDIELADNTPYKYYLQTIEICNENPPRLFLQYLNHIYALGKSKFQMTSDSIERAKYGKENIETIEITGQVLN